MAIKWSIVEAIGTWFSGIITAGTLLFMYVQYHNDKKERLEKEERDKAYEFLQEQLLLIDTSMNSLFNIQDEQMSAILETPQRLTDYNADLKLLSQIANAMGNGIKLFKEQDLMRGGILELKFLASSTYKASSCYEHFKEPSHTLNKLLRELREKK